MLLNLEIPFYKQVNWRDPTGGGPLILNQSEQQPIVEDTFIEAKVVDNKAGFPIGHWGEESVEETMTSTITETSTSKKSSSTSEHEAVESSSSSDEAQEGVRSKVIEHHHEEEIIEANEQVRKTEYWKIQ